MEKSETNSNLGLKITIGILGLLLAGSLYYTSTIINTSEKVQAELVTVVSEKQTVLKDLESLKATYDAAIAENSTMSEELVAERDKVVKLINDINKSKGDVSQFKTKYLKLESNLKVLMAENEGLKKLNTTLTTQRDSTVVVLGEAKKFNEVLVGQNEDLSKTIEKGSKLSVLNMQTAAYKIRNSGKQEVTDKASRADILKISFTIAENQIAKSADKEYYVQVIDSRSNVLGDKQTIKVEDKTFTYSFIAKVKYENKTVQVSEDLPGKDFAKGTYFVNVFDKNELVSKTSFTLR